MKIAFNGGIYIGRMENGIFDGIGYYCSSNTIFLKGMKHVRSEKFIDLVDLLKLIEQYDFKYEEPRIGDVILYLSWAGSIVVAYIIGKDKIKFVSIDYSKEHLTEFNLNKWNYFNLSSALRQIAKNHKDR